MVNTSSDTIIWKKYLLKKMKGSQFGNARTVSRENVNDDFQIFEVLVCETFQILYPDYTWRVTPAQGDGGVDFFGEQEARPMPSLFQVPSLVIYGQVKRKKNGFRQEDLLNATDKMIRYYLKRDIQRKSLQQLIHVVSSDKPINSQIEPSIEHKDSLIYVVTTVNAEDLFHLWACNTAFLNHILPLSYLNNEREEFLKAVYRLYGDSESPYDVQISVNTPVFCDYLFEVDATFVSRVSFPISLSVVWIPQGEIPNYLVSPQGLFERYHGYDILLIHSYRLVMKFRAPVSGSCDLGCIRILNRLGNQISEISLGNIQVRPSYGPAYFALPNSDLERLLRQEIDDSLPGPSFYSVVGEGGIGKSTFLQEILNYAVNYGYRSIVAEHECEITDESDFWRDFFRQLAGPPGGTLYFQDTMMNELRQAMGPYYRETWANALQKLFDSGNLEMSRDVLDCWLCLNILAAEKAPLFIWISNMHWCSPAAIDLFLRCLKSLQQNKAYFLHKIIIVFEGRTEEALRAHSSNSIPYEWFNFLKNPFIREIRLHKWEKKQCQQYITGLLSKKNPSDAYLMQSRKIEQFLIEHGSGNPMHIKELIRYLVQQNNLKYLDNGRLMVLSAIISEPINTLILDIIQARVTYYRRTEPGLIDFLILGAHLGDWPTFNQYAISFCKKYDGDIDNVMHEMGFASFDQRTGHLAFTHEHYKTVLAQEVLSFDSSVADCLSWIQRAEIVLPVQIECRLLLLCHSVDYEMVCRKLLDSVEKSFGDLAYFEILKLLEQIPTETLEKCGMPLYHLYRLLESACMLMGNWETAEAYVQLLKELEEDCPAYHIDVLFARKSLSNNYSFRMKFDSAQEECKDAIQNLESYLAGMPPMSPQEKKALLRELCMLKNRLAIIYFLSGKHTEAWEQNKEARSLAKQEGDLYVKYHIQYEEGLWKLRDEPQIGLEWIKDSYKELPDTEQLPGTQEMDLVRADYRIAQLKAAGLTGEFSKEMLDEVKQDAAEGCRRLSNTRERLESMLYHTLYGIVSVIENNLQNALKYFQMSAEIAYRASMPHMIWKMHLNIAQCYCLLSEASSMDEEYRSNIRFHAQEAFNILNQSLNDNVLVFDTFQKVLDFPMALTNQLLEGKLHPQLTGHNADYCGIHINFRNYAFFLLD